jgi:hypothetical protein
VEAELTIVASIVSPTSSSAPEFLVEHGNLNRQSSIACGSLQMLDPFVSASAQPGNQPASWEVDDVFREQVLHSKTARQSPRHSSIRNAVKL